MGKNETLKKKRSRNFINQKCFVPGCKSRYVVSGVFTDIKFYKFPPLTNEQLYKKWKKVIKSKEEPTDSSRVCNLHFQEEDFNKNKGGGWTWPTLKVSAYPRLRLPAVVPPPPEAPSPPSKYQTRLSTSTIVTRSAGRDTSPRVANTSPSASNSEKKKSPVPPSSPPASEAGGGRRGRGRGTTSPKEREAAPPKPIPSLPKSGRLARRKRWKKKTHLRAKRAPKKGDGGAPSEVPGDGGSSTPAGDRGAPEDDRVTPAGVDASPRIGRLKPPLVGAAVRERPRACERTCCVPGCGGRSPSGLPYLLFGMPSHPLWRDRWLAAIFNPVPAGRGDPHGDVAQPWQIGEAEGATSAAEDSVRVLLAAIPKVNVMVCSVHFPDGRPSPGNPLPTLKVGVARPRQPPVDVGWVSDNRPGPESEHVDHSYAVPAATSCHPALRVAMPDGVVVGLGEFLSPGEALPEAEDYRRLLQGLRPLTQRVPDGFPPPLVPIGVPSAILPPEEAIDDASDHADHTYAHSPEKEEPGFRYAIYQPRSIAGATSGAGPVPPKTGPGLSRFDVVPVKVSVSFDAGAASPRTGAAPTTVVAAPRISVAPVAQLMKLPPTPTTRLVRLSNAASPRLVPLSRLLKKQEAPTPPTSEYFVPSPMRPAQTPTPGSGPAWRAPVHWTPGAHGRFQTDNGARREGGTPAPAKRPVEYPPKSFRAMLGRPAGEAPPPPLIRRLAKPALGATPRLEVVREPWNGRQVLFGSPGSYLLHADPSLLADVCLKEEEPESSRAETPEMPEGSPPALDRVKEESGEPPPPDFHFVDVGTFALGDFKTELDDFGTFDSVFTAT